MAHNHMRLCWKLPVIWKLKYVLNDQTSGQWALTMTAQALVVLWPQHGWQFEESLGALYHVAQQLCPWIFAQIR